MDLESIRNFCLALPGVTEDLKWGEHLCFSVAGKLFLITSLDGPRISFKADPERFDELVATPGFLPAPHLHHNKWVANDIPEELPASELQALLRHSYELVKAKLSKKIQASLEVPTDRP